jgi:hypothetical protein
MLRIQWSPAAIAPNDISFAFAPTLARRIFLHLIVMLGAQATQVVERISTTSPAAHDVVHVGCPVPAASHSTAVGIPA